MFESWYYQKFPWPTHGTITENNGYCYMFIENNLHLTMSAIFELLIVKRFLVTETDCITKVQAISCILRETPYLHSIFLLFVLGGGNGEEYEFSNFDEVWLMHLAAAEWMMSLPHFSWKMSLFYLILLNSFIHRGK